MANEHVWTATELEALSPNERHAVVRAGFVTDPALVPADLLDRARRKIATRISQTEGTQPSR